MTEAKRAFPIILVHLLLGIAICLVYSFVKPVQIDLIEPFITPYRIRAGILLFVGFMPALIISGMLIGYALAFSKNTADSTDRWSALLLAYLKGAFGLCLVCIAGYVIMSEGFAPIFTAKQTESAARSEDYRKYVSVVRDSLAAEHYSEADLQVKGALMIWPKNREALALQTQIQLKLADGVVKSPVAETVLATDAMLGNSSGLTVLEALIKAEEAKKTNDFYNTHYYAMLAYRLAPGTDPNRAVAIALASEAWNQISQSTSLLSSRNDSELYATKRSGYDAIQNGDYLKAYYIFLELHERELASGDGLHDPDVERFLAISRKGVLDSFFFTDETVNMKLFEANRNVFFVIKRADGTFDSLFARGITYTRLSGRDIAYLRDLEYAHFDRDNLLQYQISVPYVKMFPYNPGKTPARPELLLRSVDRNVAGSGMGPTVITGQLPEGEGNALVLDMPYDDLNLIVAANRGASAMTLVQLFRFFNRAETYGFSRTVFLSELMNRLADPFIILIISIYALILGWRYRLGQRSIFKAWWILTIPLFPILAFYLIELLRYMLRLCVIQIIGLAPQNPMLLLLAFLGVWFAGMSYYFFSQRS